jgi:hypothetical protein
MDSIAVGFVVFGVPPADNSVGVADEQAAVRGLGIVGEAVAGKDTGGDVASTYGRDKALPLPT